MRGTALTAGVAIPAGRERPVPVTIPVPAEVPWGWTDALLVTRFKLGTQAVWAPRRVTIRPRPPLEVSPGGADGALNPELPSFVKPDDAKPAGRETDDYIGHDGVKLYVAYVCHGQPEPRAVQRPHDGAVWEDDCVGTFLQPPGGETYYHLAVNAAGARFEARCPGSDASWNPDWEAKEGRLPDGWVAEIAVPWSVLPGQPEGP